MMRVFHLIIIPQNYLFFNGELPGIRALDS